MATTSPQPGSHPPPPIADPLQLIEDLPNPVDGPAIDGPTIARARRLTLAPLGDAIQSAPVQAELGRVALRSLPTGGVAPRCPAG